MLRQVVLYIAFFIVAAASESVFSTTVEEFKTACESSSNIGAEVCLCIGEHAKNDLSDNAFEFLTAGMQKDFDKTAALRANMGMEELMAASMYMVNGAKNCAETGQ